MHATQIQLPRQTFVLAILPRPFVGVTRVAPYSMEAQELLLELLIFLPPFLIRFGVTGLGTLSVLQSITTGSKQKYATSRMIIRPVALLGVETVLATVSMRIAHCAQRIAETALLVVMVSATVLMRIAPLARRIVETVVAMVHATVPMRIVPLARRIVETVVVMAHATVPMRIVPLARRIAETVVAMAHVIVPMRIAPLARRIAETVVAMAHVTVPKRIATLARRIAETVVAMAHAIVQMRIATLAHRIAETALRRAISSRSCCSSSLAGCCLIRFAPSENRIDTFKSCI